VTAATVCIRPALFLVAAPLQVATIEADGR
jgi:hypothetical protein